jgi:hypothetical protein
MNDMNQRNLSTADLAAAAQPAPSADEAERRRGERREDEKAEARRDEARSGDGRDQLAPLFPGDLAQQFRSRWDQVQSGFVDDPREAVRHGDELVAQVMKSLAESFAAERQKLEDQFRETDSASTENLRLAFRRYRSFFERLLSF